LRIRTLYKKKTTGSDEIIMRYKQVPTFVVSLSKRKRGWRRRKPPYNPGTRFAPSWFVHLVHGGLVPPDVCLCGVVVVGLRGGRQQRLRLREHSTAGRRFGGRGSIPEPLRGKK